MDGNEHRSRASIPVSRGPSHDALVLHATAVAWNGDGLLILGRSGAGKSGLALRLMALGARLVADDRIILHRRGTDLVARSPQPLEGLVEARGVGLLHVPHAASARVIMAVDLDTAPGARMPEASKIPLLGCNIRLICGRDVPNLDAIITVVAQNQADIV